MPGLFEGAYGDNDRAVPILEHDETLYQVESHKRPLLRLIGQDSEMAENALQDWEMETEGTVPLTGVMDGEDVSSFNSQAQGYAESYIAHLRESWMVTKVGSKVKTAGIKDMKLHQRKKAMERLLNKMERVLGSGIEMARGNKTTPYMTRGAFAWLVASLQTLTGKTVPTDYMPASACIHTAALSGLDADAFEAMLNAASEQTLGPVELMGQAGLTLKAQMSAWTQKVDYDATPDQQLVTYNGNISDKKFVKMVNTFEFDAGIVEVMLNQNLCYSAAGAKTDYSSRSGIFMNLPVWKKRYMQQVKEFELTDGGGGPRGYADVLMLLKCGMPAGQCAVYASS